MEIFGDDPAALFINAGHALFDALVQTADRPPEGAHRHIFEIQGHDWADLMINWLKELLYLFNGEQQILVHIRLESLSENDLKATVTTQDIPPQSHFGQEFKAVTYHQLQVGPLGDRWRARVIFDI